MTSPKLIKLVKSDKSWLNRRALELLAELDGTTITILPFERVLYERFELPFVETEDGRRAYGVDGIKKFVENIQHRNS